MAFMKGEKRKTSTPSSLPDKTVTHINLKDRSITDGHSTANFERLLYKGCPVLPMEGRRIHKSKNQPIIVDANRKELAVKICNSIHSLDSTTRTKINIFREAVSFIRMLDAEGIQTIFCFESVSMYLTKLGSCYEKGVKGKSLLSRQNCFKTLLIELDAKLFEQCKDSFISYPTDSDSIKPYTDAELKSILSALYLIYNDYSRHIEDDTIPSTFPLYAAKNPDGSYQFKSIGSSKRSTFYRNSDTVWKNDLVRVAYFITCFHTGINSTPLLELRLSDLTEEPFQDITRRAYKLKTVKRRQAGKTNEIDAGFTKKSKIFFRKWISISKKLNFHSDGFLFPNLSNNKTSMMTSSNISIINKYIIALGIPALSSQRFRKTKASLIMRATESIFMVAQGLNNSVHTAAKHYSDGDSVTTEFSLASALYIREQTALGKSLDDAVKDSVYIFRDPVKNIDNGNKFKKLSNGLRCGDAFGEKSKKIKNALIKEGLATNTDIIACHKFLECFGCKHHAVIAEIDDIWLLLSFSDVILQAATRPSINSKPSVLLNKVNSTLQAIIYKLKHEHASNYRKAYEKYLEEPHPIWQDVSDLELMMETY